MFPALADAGPLFVITRSACVEIVVEALEALLLEFVSTFEVDDTAVFVTTVPFVMDGEGITVNVN